MNLKKNGKVFTSKFVGTGPSSYEKRIYRAAVSQRLRNTALDGADICLETDLLPSTCRSVVDFVLLVIHEIDFDLGRCFARES